ncbi:hypothetical protein ABPG77_011380 [Micractinium sp. CCAP 211/92]
MQRSWDGGAEALAGLVSGLHIGAVPHTGAKFGHPSGHHNEWQQQQMTLQPTGLHPEFAHLAAATAPYQRNGAPLPPPHANGYGMAVPVSTPAPQQHSMGWGGQAIPENGTFKAPWFGKSRGRGGPAGGRGRGRGRGGHAGSAGPSSGRRGSRRGYDGGGGLGGPPDELSIDSLVALVGAIPASQPISDTVYQALFQLDGRACALLLKDLSKAGLQFRATELFDWIRALDDGHPLQSLLDVYSYTAMISLCITEHDVDRALKLAAEMKAKGIERNVHTYTALMNVCIKCSKHTLALDTYKLMRQDRCTPNVVTFNTLIDVYGKMGSWEEAVNVLALMKSEGVEPVLRTFNTLIIACNMCNQPREAMAVYRRMLEEGYSPNSTTYNALISAYGKAGQLDKVMEVFQEMMYRGCERSVITYSSLISACEKAGQWELALELFQEMLREQCTPNTVTFNSLITALAQGAQWQKASEVFEQMQTQGCHPDVVTYTALISALEKGGQWRLALEAYDRMKAQGCRADAIVYNAIIDALWETGVVWVQRRALRLFRVAVEEGHFHQGKLVPGLARAEVNLHAMTAGVAMLSLYAWLVSIKQLLVQHGTAAMPVRLAIVTDRGKGSKEQGNLVVKEAVQASMALWSAPFKAVIDGGYTGMLEAPGTEVCEWLLSDNFEARIFTFYPCTDITPTVANQVKSRDSVQSVSASLDDPDHLKESSVEQRCSEAFAAVRHFEKTHCLALQNMGHSYLQRRSELVGKCLEVATRLGVREEAGHDGVLLMDRVMSTSLQLAPDLLDLLAVGCVVIAAKQVDGHASAAAPVLPPEADVQAASGLPAAAVEQMEWNIRQVLSQDTAAISTLRCLKLFLERMGAHHLDGPSMAAMAGRAMQLVTECLTEMAFLNCRPSVIAAALLYVERRSRGLIPFWPSMLAKLTGYQDMSTPELSVAIKAAQRLCGRSAGIPRPMSNPRSLSRSPSAQQLSTSSSSSAIGSGSSVPSIATSTNANSSLSGSLPAMPVPAAVPVSVAPAATASLSSSELAAAVAAATAAAGVGVAPAALGMASHVQHVSSAEHALSALRQAGSSVGSGSITPPPVTAAAVPVAGSAVLTPEQLLQQLAPAVAGGVQVPAVPLVPGVAAFAPQLP